MQCQKVTNIKGGFFEFRGKKYCQKEAVTQDQSGRKLCQHHYNKWVKKVEKSKEMANKRLGGQNEN
jgi:hypothetical protein